MAGAASAIEIAGRGHRRGLGRHRAPDLTSQPRTGMLGSTETRSCSRTGASGHQSETGRPRLREPRTGTSRTSLWSEGRGSRNRDKARSIKDRLSRDNSTKELFPPKLSTAGAGKAQMDKVDLADRVTRQLGGMSVFYQSQRRIQVGTGSSSSRGYGTWFKTPAELTPASPADHAIKPPETGINIRGMAIQRTEQGLSIKGAATSAKELFPNKLHGNAGKELFSNKLEGRRPRQKAEDLFR